MAVTITKANYPALLTGVGVSGKDFLLYVGYGEGCTKEAPVWSLVGGLTEQNLNLAAEVSTKLTIDSGLWTEGALTGKSAEFSASVIAKRDDVGQSAISNFLLQDDVSIEKGALMFAVVDKTTKDYVQFVGIPISWETAYSADDMVTKSFSVTIIGAPEEKTNFSA